MPGAQGLATLPDDVVTESAAIVGVPIVNISIRDAPSTGVILYFLGGAYAIAWLPTGASHP